jgi:hypothetical protein
VRRNSNGTRGLNRNSCHKEIRIRDSFSVANGQHRKKLIHSLVQDGGLIEGQEQLKSYTTSYYKGLFGALEESYVSMDESRIDDIPQVSLEENVILTSPY